MGFPIPEVLPVELDIKSISEQWRIRKATLYHELQIASSRVLELEQMCENRPEGHDLQENGNQHNCTWYKCTVCGFQKKV